ncbi:MAG: hypothetical protein CL414_01260 [Acidimicrobiaceae bacterium]|nr:hypothetical protein [Acidimicrobiaceae bacterium]
MVTIDIADRLELHELPGRYGDAIDDRNWDRLREIFTDDAVFDLTGVGARRLEGIDDIVHFMNVEASHPKTHMMTNIYVDEQDENVIMNFRIVALLGKGLVGTASYYDRVVKTGQGWRVQHRECMIHRRDKRDAPCDENN